MLWLIITLVTYFTLAIVYLIDKHLLTSNISDPKIYTIYVSILVLFIIFLAPFTHFYLPSFNLLMLCFAAGISFTACLYFFYTGVQRFEVSRVVPAIGALKPILITILIYIISLGKEKIPLSVLLAFIVLIIGGVLITYEREKKITWQSLKISFLTAFTFALFCVLSKYAYFKLPFLNALIWMKIGGALPALAILIFSSKTRQEIKQNLQATNFSQKKKGFFVLNQIFGASSGLLQNWAIALAPIIYLPVINALQGTQYVFLLIFTVFLSLKSPQILKEEISRKTLLQKIFGIIFIGVGLAIIAFFK